MLPTEIKPRRIYDVRRKLGPGHTIRQALVLKVEDHDPPDFPGHRVYVQWFHNGHNTGASALIHHDDVIEEAHASN